MTHGPNVAALGMCYAKAPGVDPAYAARLFNYGKHQVGHWAPCLTGPRFRFVAGSGVAAAVRRAECLPADPHTAPRRPNRPAPPCPPG